MNIGSCRKAKYKKSDIQLILRDFIMTEKTLSRREKEKLRHREDLLNGALKLFNEKGFHNVSIQDIADASECAVGTVYNFFESKNQLFEEILAASCKRIEESFLPILDDPDLNEVQKISKYIKNCTKVIEENLDFLRVYVGHYGSSAVVNSAEEATESSKELIGSKVVKIIESGIAKGVFNEVSPDVGAMAINAALESFALNSSMDFDKEQVRQKVDEIEKFFMGALLKDK